MKQALFRAAPGRKPADTATVFFTGWGSSPARFAAALSTPARDTVLLWAYDGASWDDAVLADYRAIRVVGWSLGVRIAAEWLLTYRKPAHQTVERFTAVAGTLTPIDRRCGISPLVFDRTTDGWCEDTWRGFLLNMTGTSGAECPTDRDLDSLGRELRYLRDAYRSAHWTGTLSEVAHEIHAVLPEHDRIFPTAAQKRAWTEASVPFTTVPEAHWCPKAIARTLCEN